MTYETRITTVIHAPTDAAIFEGDVTYISIDNEAAGEFVVVKQIDDTAEPGTIKICPDEWPTLRQAINRMVRGCREDKE